MYSIICISQRKPGALDRRHSACLTLLLTTIDQLYNIPKVFHVWSGLFAYPKGYLGHVLLMQGLATSLLSTIDQLYRIRKLYNTTQCIIYIFQRRPGALSRQHGACLGV